MICFWLDKLQATNTHHFLQRREAVLPPDELKIFQNPIRRFPIIKQVEEHNDEVLRKLE